MKLYKPEVGETIENTAFNMIQLANQSGEPVKSQFNDYEFVAYPGDTLDQVEQRWKDERDRKSIEKNHNRY